MTDQRVSDDELAMIVADLEAEDARAKDSGETHGNYGEDFGGIALDLRDARAEIAWFKSDRIVLVERAVRAGMESVLQGSTGCRVLTIRWDHGSHSFQETKAAIVASVLAQEEAEVIDKCSLCGKPGTTTDDIDDHLISRQVAGYRAAWSRMHSACAIYAATLLDDRES